MKKIAILGCENSHADTFLKYIKTMPEYSDIEVVGVYSDEPEAARALSEKHGVPVLEKYTDAVGAIDGLIITARHGDNHYKYAKPYIGTGIPMFIDKPITISEDEAVTFMRALRDNNVRISGGSCLKYEKLVKELRAEALSEKDGKTVGGAVRAPISSASVYGGIYFYAQHLVEMICEIFGRYPRSVLALENGETKNVIFRYDSFDAIGTYADNSSAYYAARYTKTTSHGGECDLSASACFLFEFEEFVSMLNGAEQKISYEDFISPVFIMNAIERSLKSGKEEEVRGYSL